MKTRNSAADIVRQHIVRVEKTGFPTYIKNEGRESDKIRRQI